jgi:hypothetical protein
MFHRAGRRIDLRKVYLRSRVSQADSQKQKIELTWDVALGRPENRLVGVSSQVSRYPTNQ